MSHSGIVKTPTNDEITLHLRKCSSPTKIIIFLIIPNILCKFLISTTTDYLSEYSAPENAKNPAGTTGHKL